jgi:hypothetical protein
MQKTTKAQAILRYITACLAYLRQVSTPSFSAA